MSRLGFAAFALLTGCSPMVIQSDPSLNSGVDPSSPTFYLGFRGNDLTVYFSENITAPSGGALTKDDFTVSISSGVATLGNAWNAVQITSSRYQLNLDLQASPNGLELAQIALKPGRALNAAGKSVGTLPQSIYLYDRVAPTYSITLGSDNSLRVNFTEEVGNSAFQDLVKADFDITLVGGTATKGVAWNVTKNSTTEYLVNLDLQGPILGTEIVHVNLVPNHVYDLSNNEALSLDRTTALNDTWGPTFQIQLTNTNHVLVNFDEVATKAGGADLDASNFTVRIENGSALLGTWVPTKISPQQYSIDLDLSEAPDGNEIVYVDITAGTVVDAGARVAAQSEKSSPLLASNLTLLGPLQVNVNSEVTFGATGGSSTGYTYAILSGAGLINPASGVFLAPNHVGTTVIQVTDSRANTSQAQIHVGGSGIYWAGGWNGVTHDEVMISFNGLDWSVNTVLPATRGEVSLIVFKDKLYFIGGYTGGQQDDVWSSLNGLNWTTHLAVLPANVGMGSVAVYNNKIWYLGGSPGGTNVWNSADGINWTNTGWALPASRTRGDMVVYNDRMWYLGGGSNTVWWSNEGSNWHNADGLLLPGVRDGNVATVFNNKMWSIGGSSTTDVWWSTDGADWHDADNFNLPNNRSEGRLVSFNSRLWYLAGQQSGGYTSTSYSSFDGQTWLTHPSAIPDTRIRYDVRVFTDRTAGPDLGTLTFNSLTLPTANDTHSIKWDPSTNGIYAGSATEGLFVSKNNGSTWTQYTIAQGLFSNTVFSVFKAGTNNIYLGTAGGVSISTDDGTTWATSTTAAGLPSNTVNEIFVDRGGTIYAATEAGLAISSTGGVSWTGYTTAQGLIDNRIRGVFADINNVIYLATPAGISLSRNGGTTWTNYTTAQGLGSNDVRKITVSTNGLIFAATAGGLTISLDNATTWRNLSTIHGLPSSDLSAVTVDNYGNIYLSSLTVGLIISRDHGKTWTLFDTNDGLATNNISEISISPTAKVYTSCRGAGVSVSVP